MYLRSLEMQGFKSFPDKTKLEFDKGITAIVGPNGSGKSNIGDAMRWVMGERSVKDLRGKKMEDVIFDGTLHRKRASYAQVTLIIDNADRSLNIDSDIVEVARKLYRKGESDYMINGRQVRLSDVEELFMDTGLGSDGYAIIGQGKIGEIVSNKAADRRQIFDEAAGISKFRRKKRETENDLLKAEDNISRLTDIIGELERQIGPLEKQCEKAKQFKVLDAEKSELEVSLWVMRIRELLKIKSSYKEELLRLTDETHEVESETQELEEKIAACNMQAAEQTDKIAALREDIHRIEMNDSQAAAREAVLKNDIEHLQERIERIAKDRAQSEKSRADLDRQLEQNNAELDKLHERAKVLDEKIVSLNAQLTGAQSELAAREGELERMGAHINELYLKKSNETFRLETAKNNCASAMEQIAAVKAESEGDKGRYNELTKELKELEAERARLDKENTETQNRIAGSEMLYKTKSQKFKSAQEELADSSYELRECEQRLGILRDMERSLEGFYGSVKFILNAAVQGRIRGVCGSVGQIISTAPEYGTAIETALGAAMQNIVVESEETAIRGIKLLKDNRAGRATFLPLTSVRGNEFSQPPRGEEGYIALASELVRYEDRFAGVVKSLLGRVAVAEDISSASAIAKRHGYKFKIVTLDGQIVNAGGAYTGGSTSKSAGILTRKSEIEELERKAEELSANNKKLKQSCTNISQEVQNLAAELEGRKEELTEITNGLLRTEVECRRVKELISRLDEEKGKRAENISKYENLLSEAEIAADEAAKKLSELESEIAAEEKERALFRDEMPQAAQKRAQLADDLSALRIDRAECAKDEQACLAQINNTRQLIEHGQDDEEKLKAESEECAESIKAKRVEIVRIKEEVSGSPDKIAEIETLITQTQAQNAKFRREADRLGSEMKIKSERSIELASERTRLEERDKTLSAEFDKLVGRLWDDYGLTRSDADEQFSPPENVKAARARLTELKEQIKKLGSVNLGAIEEYAEVSERYEFMTGQLNDVTTSKRELEQLIEELTDSMKSIFTENFEKIAGHFSQIFCELFGGGKGTLSLSDPENVLECGIDIDVQPPGKVQKNLMSLSGGETGFIAVCILFAILTVRPSPFCLLDEIEAAFDDVNVAKYAAYLHKFTDKTQFIAITHRRGTMEEADVLYGVTMQEDGISKLLRMDMEEERRK